MSILKQIKVDQLQARKDKNKDKASLLTTLIGELETLEKNQGNISDNDVLSKIKKFIEGNTEVINNISENDDRYSKALNENVVLSSYLPKQLTEDELRAEIQEVIDTGFKDGVKPIGIIMGHLKKEFPNQYDAGLASKIVRELV